jgi:hypothetical protein
MPKSKMSNDKMSTLAKNRDTVQGPKCLDSDNWFGFLRRYLALRLGIILNHFNLLQDYELQFLNCCCQV